MSLIDKEIKSENDNLSSLLTEKKLIDMSLNANQTLYNKLENAYKNKVVTITDKNNAQSQLMESVLQQSSLQRVIYEKKEKIIDLKIQKSTLEEKLKYSSSSRKEKEINNMINIYNNTEKMNTHNFLRCREL